MTEEEKAIKIAKKFGLEEEVKIELEHGATPEEALTEWGIIPRFSQ